VLEKASRPYRIAYTARSATGSLVPVLAGLAITCGVAVPLPDGARILDPAEANLPELPDFAVLMLKAKNPAQPVTDRLAAHIAAATARERQRVIRN
jgi:hypothetical protein